MRFIHAILELVFPARRTEHLVNTSSLEQMGVVLSVRSTTSNASIVTSLLPYRDSRVRALILEAKFHEHTRAHNILGRMLAEYLQAYVEEDAFTPSRYILVPIPLSKQRFRERGYNQAARIVAVAQTHLPASFSTDTCILARIRNTRAQTTLGRSARNANMQGAFSVRGSITLDHTYIVIDDVTTTGATLRAACDALTEAGAERVEGVALAG